MDFAVLAQAQEIFLEQVNTDQLAQNLVYATGTVGALIILAGLVLVDVAGVRRVNVLDSAVQKLIGFFIGVAVFFLVGFAIWQWQYYVAFDVPNPYWQAIKDWWLGGTLSSEFAHRVDPAVAPGLNNSQIFIFFLAAFAGIVNVLIHLSVTERIKPLAYYIISAVTALVWSVLGWLLWGSTSPVTNLGFHDFFGVAFFYIFTGAMCLVLSWRCGQRAGMFQPHPRVPEYRSYNLGLTTLGVILIFAGLPMVVLSCGFFFEGVFYGVSMAESGVGIAFNNLAVAWTAGALAGALIAYRTRKVIYVLLGPLAGYFAGTPAFDVYEPWQMFLVGLAAPFVAYAVYETIHRRGLDEHKLVPLGLGCGTFGGILVGLIAWGTPQSGFFGLESGDYAFQHAEVTVYWQLLGVSIAIGVGLLTALVLAVVLERTIGLRVPEEVQIEGYDLHYWETAHDVWGPEPVPAGEPAAVPAGFGDEFAPTGAEPRPAT